MDGIRTVNPDVSVVMSVYNERRYLDEAVRSILSQEGVEFEFIIIDDGSDEDVAAQLRRYAAEEERIRLIRQENQGLTRALIRGCAVARGEFIARQDADDISVQGRLQRQLAMLRKDPALSFVACWVETIGPDHEVLCLSSYPTDSSAARQLLLQGRFGPVHGSVIFRRDVYERVGGYRWQLRYAQDADLWLRLGELGGIGYVAEVLYRFRMSAGSISGQKCEAQRRCACAVDELYEARKNGGSEVAILNKLGSEGFSETTAAQSRVGEAMSLYFIGKCLLARRDARARAYFWRCIRARPQHWRAWLGLVYAGFVCRRGADGRQA